MATLKNEKRKMARTRRRRKTTRRRRRKRQCGDCRPRGHQVHNSLHLTLGWTTSCPVLCSRAAFMASRGPIRFITQPGAENNILGRSLFLGSREGWDSGVPGAREAAWAVLCILPRYCYEVRLVWSYETAEIQVMYIFFISQLPSQ